MPTESTRGAKRARRAQARQGSRQTSLEAAESMRDVMASSMSKRKRPQGRKRACSHLARTVEQKLAAKYKPFFSVDELGKFRADSLPYVPSIRQTRYKPKTAK